MEMDYVGKHLSPLIILNLKPRLIGRFIVPGNKVQRELLSHVPENQPFIRVLQETVDIIFRLVYINCLKFFVS